MADTWQDLAALAETPADTDDVLVRDVSDTTDAAAGTVKRNTRPNFLGTSLSALTSAFTPASSAGPATLDLHEDTDNGSNRVRLTAPAALSVNRTATLPDADGTLALTSNIPVQGAQVGPVDANITYSRATHGDMVTFFYGASVPLTSMKTLTFPFSEGVTGGMAIVRVREDAGWPILVRLEDPDNPGTYSEVEVDNATRILRKSVTGSWWTDMGQFINNGQMVSTQGDAIFVIETIQNDTPRLYMARQDGTHVWHAFRIDASGNLIVRYDTTNSDRMSISPTGVVNIGGTVITPASTAAAASIALPEDTDNGVNTVTLQAPALVAANRTVTFPDATGTVALTSDMSTPNFVDLKQDYDAVGDGSADDGPELSAALTAIMTSGRTLFVPKGTYLATTWTPLTISGPIRIRMEPGAIIRIPGTTAFFASGPATFYEFNVEGGEIDMDTGGRIAEWRGHSAGSSVLPLFRLVDVTIRNAINTATPTEASAKCFDMWDSSFDRILIDRIEFTRATFIGGSIAVELAGVQDGVVTDCRFFNQTYLGCAINRATDGLTSLHESRSGRISFLGNKFKDIINSSSSADTHGLMLFGSGYSVVGNHFQNIRSGSANGNCEGYYSKGQDILIQGNVFEDAGGARGFISLKGTDFLDSTPAQQHPEGYSIVVSGNTFRCTAAMIASPWSANIVAIHLEAVNVLIANNSFYDMAVYRTMTVDTEQFDNGGVVMIHNNLFVDCGAGNDTQVLSLSFLGALVRLSVHANVFIYEQRVGGRIIYLENATCHASIKNNLIRGNATTAATKGIWIRSTGASMIASADVTGNRFTQCTAGLEVSGGSGAVALLIHGDNRHGTTGAIQETISSTITTDVNLDAAAATTFAPTGAIAATTVQTAIAELDTEKAPIASPTFTGTVTVPNDSISYAEIQNVSAASRLLGRGDSGSGDPQEISLGSGLSMTGTTLAVSAGGGNVSSAGTPVDNQLAVWTGASTIEGDTELTWDDAVLTVRNIVLTPASAAGAASLFLAEDTDNGVLGVSIAAPAQVATSSKTATLQDASGTLAYIGDITYETLSAAGDVGTGAGQLAIGNHAHAAGDVTSGTFADARISQSSVTQHQAALSLTENQIQLGATDVLVGRQTAGAGAAEEIACTSAGRALLDDADATAQRSTLGLVIGTNVQAYNSDLDALITAFTPASTSGPATLALAEDTDNGANTVSLSAPSSIGGNVTLTFPATASGQIYAANNTDVALADGGTGASLTDPNADRIMFWDDSAGAVTWLAPGTGLGISGTDIAITDAELLALAGLTSAADALPYFTGSGTAAVTTVSSFIRTLLDDADAATARSTLGVTGGGNVSNTGTPADNQLAIWTGATTIEGDSDVTWNDTIFTIRNIVLTPAVSGTAASVFLPEATTNGLFGVSLAAPAQVATSSKTATLQDVTGTLYVSGGQNVAVADGGTGADDPAGARTALGLVIGTDVQAFDADLTTLSTAFTSAGGSAASLKLAEPTGAGSTGVLLTGPTTSASDKAVTFQDVAGTVYVTGGTDVAVVDGGTGASDAATARTNLGLVIGTDVPPVNNASFTGTFTVPNDSISYAEIQNVSATDRLLGRDTAAAGDIEELTVGGGVEFTGSGGIQRSALTGDVTASAGSNATTIANNAVTYAKMQDVTATDRLLGRSTAGAGDVEEITCTAAGRAILDDANAAAQLTTLGALPLAGGTMTGALEGGGQTLGGFLGKVVTVSGSPTLTASTHCGNILVAQSDFTIPTTAGFCATVIFTGAYRMNFNSTQTSLFANNDIATFVVQSSTVIRATKVAAASLVAFA